MKPIATSLFHRVFAPRAQSTKPHPALIMLHGRGADEEDLLGLSDVLDERLLILSPRAPYTFEDGPGFTWYDVGEIGMPEPAMFKNSYEKLSTFVEDAITHYPVDTTRVFLFGFSMGTVMSYSLSLTRPEMFRGVVANSGYVPAKTHLSFRWDALANIDFFISHGTLDPVIPVGAGRQARDLFNQAHARITYREYPMGHQIGEQSLNDAAAWLQERLTGD